MRRLAWCNAEFCIDTGFRGLEEADMEIPFESMADIIGPRWHRKRRKTEEWRKASAEQVDEWRICTHLDDDTGAGGLALRCTVIRLAECEAEGRFCQWSKVESALTHFHLPVNWMVITSSAAAGALWDYIQDLHWDHRTEELGSDRQMVEQVLRSGSYLRWEKLQKPRRAALESSSGPSTSHESMV